jgi:hypothetical protein
VDKEYNVHCSTILQPPTGFSKHWQSISTAIKSWNGDFCSDRLGGGPLCRHFAVVSVCLCVFVCAINRMQFCLGSSSDNQQEPCGAGIDNGYFCCRNTVDFIQENMVYHKKPTRIF